MKNLTYFFFLVTIWLLTIFIKTNYSQEFPIAVGIDTTFSAGAVYGGGQGLVAIYGNNLSQYSINAQIIGQGGTLVGSRISLNSFGVFPGAYPAFDGANYFLIWCDFTGVVKGRFINTSGSLVGNDLTIATGININRPALSLCLSDTTYLITFVRSDNYLYGQLVGKSGILIGNQILISNNKARENSIAFDGNNFLIAWVDDVSDKNISGQFISKSGSLVGNNFLIDDGPYLSDNPISLDFDGSRYFLVFHESIAIGQNWFISGIFITPSGIVQGNMTIVPTELNPTIPSVSFDGQNHLITWTQISDQTFKGRFYNKLGNPVSESFVIMPATGDRIPMGGASFGGGLYLAVATRVNENLSDGDVYGRFISPLTAIENTFEIANQINLYQNYPNPFNPSTKISWQSSVGSHQTLKVYDVLGKEVATLLDEYREAGRHEIEFNTVATRLSLSLPSGVYFYQLRIGNYTETKKMILVR